jgi:hypothetical protein
MNSQNDTKPSNDWKLPVAIITLVIAVLGFFYGSGQCNQTNHPSWIIPVLKLVCSKETTFVTPTPVPASGAIQPLIDDFNNPIFDGSFNPDKWFTMNLEYNKIAQENGVLVISLMKNAINDTGLYARDYHFIPFNAMTSGSGMFFEAKLKLSPEERNGNVHMQIYSELPAGQWWNQCTISNSNNQEQVACNLYPQNHVSSFKFDDYGTWHTFRIEVDSSKMNFSYFLDGNLMDYVPIDTENLKNASFSFLVGVNGTNVTGYIDDVRIGQIGLDK